MTLNAKAVHQALSSSEELKEVMPGLWVGQRVSPNLHSHQIELAGVKPQPINEEAFLVTTPVFQKQPQAK